MHPLKHHLKDTNQDRNKAKTSYAYKFSTGATNSKSVALESITLPDLSIVNESSNSEDNVWVQARKSILSLSDKESLLTLRCPLTDKHINFAQVLFKEQYPSVSGLCQPYYSTSLLQLNCQVAYKLSTAMIFTG